MTEPLKPIQVFLAAPAVTAMHVMARMQGVTLSRLVADALSKAYPSLQLHDLSAPAGARLPPNFGEHR